MHRQHLLDRLPPLNTPNWLKGGNLQTLYAKALQQPAPVYRRELLPDSTGTEKVAYDFIDAPNRHAPLVVLFHGLEGSSRSHYAIELMRAVQQRGYHGVVAHFRSCGGVPSEKMYHSGDSKEIAHMLDLLAKRYDKIYAVGVSLGGNALAKHLGEQGRIGQMAIPQIAAIISAPVDLPAAGEALEHGLPRWLYTYYFLHTLMPKMSYKPPYKIRTLGDFDNVYTAPIHGFADKNDYYRQAASKPYLRDITVPSLLLNAQNDPFLPAQYLPSENEVSPSVYLLQPENGGHVGFVSGEGRGHLQWLPQTVLRFFELIEEKNAV